MENNLHIITLNIPYPADYGGMIDSYYRIKSLSSAGTAIHLHCFEYGRSRSEKLEAICKSVNYYRRDMSFSRNFSLRPFTVNSRSSEELLINLRKDNYPILFDGLHTTFLLDHPSLSERRKLVRMHNIEHRYYETLSRFESHPARKLFYSIESVKLKRYEYILRNADILLTVSASDQEYFENKYRNAELITSFHPYERVESSEGSGNYIIFHGDLSVNENVMVAEYFIGKIFSRVPYRCILAGKNPPRHLTALAAAFKNIELVPDPDEDQMSELIKNAHINILYAIASNGLKLKLLVSLFSGRHVLANSNIIKGTILRPACNIEDSADGLTEKIFQLMGQPLTKEMIMKREQLLKPYSNRYNSERLLRLAFPDQ